MRGRTESLETQELEHHGPRGQLFFSGANLSGMFEVWCQHRQAWVGRSISQGRKTEFQRDGATRPRSHSKGPDSILGIMKPTVTQFVGWVEGSKELCRGGKKTVEMPGLDDKHAICWLSTPMHRWGAVHLAPGCWRFCGGADLAAACPLNGPDTGQQLSGQAGPSRVTTLALCLPAVPGGDGTPGPAAAPGLKPIGPVRAPHAKDPSPARASPGRKACSPRSPCTSSQPLPAPPPHPPS